MPEQGKNPFGRPVFQNLQYSDTPTQPLVPMQFTDTKAEAGKKHTYRVIAVNTVGLKSKPSAEATVAYAPPAGDAESLAGKRVVFLGDSITQAGGYVAFTTYYLEKLYPKKDFDILGLGLASETLSGLSEDGHAGGKFPRPCLFERLGRVLEKAKPEVVFACYGMNDGIYLPLDKDRFAAFQKGVTKLIEQCQKAGVKQIYLVTPPIYDFSPEEGRVQLRRGAHRVREVGDRAEGARRDGDRPAHRDAESPRRPHRALLRGQGSPRRRRAPAHGENDPRRARREGAGRDASRRSRPTRCSSWSSRSGRCARPRG